MREEINENGTGSQCAQGTLSSYSDNTCLYLYIEFVLIKYIYTRSSEKESCHATTIFITRSKNL